MSHYTVTSPKQLEKLINDRTYIEKLSYEGKKNINIFLDVLTNLKHLCFKNSNEYNCKPNLSKLSNLTSLEFNKYYDQTLNLSTLSNLEYLDLGYYYDLKTDFSKLTNLKTLLISAFFYRKIDISKLTNLTHLEFKEGGEGFDQTIDLSKLTNLKKLLFHNNYSQDVNLSTLVNLTELKLGNNKIFASSLPNLEMLKLYRSSKGFDFTSCPNLKILNLSNNEYVKNSFQDLDFTVLTNLRQLFLDKTYDNFIDFSKFPKLYIVRYGNDNLARILFKDCEERLQLYKN